LDLNTLAEDAELVARIHRTMHDQRRDYRIAFVPEPVCWTEVPHSTEILARQRRRWSQGLAEVPWKYRGMIGNPRYGRIGLITLPYYLLFELLGPILELAGVAVVAASFALGVVDLHFALVFAGVAFGYGMFVSDMAVAVEEFSFHRYRRWRDLLTAAAAAALENIGYRQAHAWWRLQGLWRFVRGHDSGWGVMTRVGFAAAATAQSPES
jgi:cellulose synthase/poly-beta-1,6-N-acetylglucosamine synthase-like glycosyltransferase